MLLFSGGGVFLTRVFCRVILYRSGVSGSVTSKYHGDFRGTLRQDTFSFKFSSSVYWAEQRAALVPMGASWVLPGIAWFQSYY